ncbi:hypothetical protein AMAG_12617 [Allomyces macrogynus ATCC 38327]|uniref:Uncharacterized protein n=1 Tax=Allomyces macrogynus (strain ATCC 38327) TaxID=578462 RepID=A0A0L0SZQ1_ALLM3|nr:hypothetical protein AMAG_12617 [Allomyces macrogynus ATCC 38327]|eukprot:KNE67900.1 hypothetical protein AMAG_12617 [Allomyces macrogynus ATCC 38327]
MIPAMPPSAPPPSAPSDASLSPLSLPSTPPSRPPARTNATTRRAPSASHLDMDAPPPSAADLAADLLALEATIQADVLLLATAPVAAGALPPIAAPTADASSPSGVPRAAFIESVLALHAIVTRKLYRAAGVSLEPYFRRHFRLSRAQVYRLLDCALLYLDFADRDASNAIDPDRLTPYPLKQRVCKTIRALAPDAGWRQQLWARTLEQHAIAQGGARPATVPPTLTDPVLAALVAPAISHVDDLTSKHIKEVWDTMLTDDAVRADVEAAVAARAVASEPESPSAADGTPVANNNDDAGSSTRSSGSRSALANRGATAPTINASPAGSSLAQRRRGRRSAGTTGSTHSAPPSVSSPPDLPPWRVSPHALQAAGDDDLLSTVIAVLQELAERGHLLQPYTRDGWEEMVVKWRFMRAPPAIARRASMAAAPWPSPTDPPVSATFFAPVPHAHAAPSSHDMDVDAIPSHHDLAAGLAAFAPPPPSTAATACHAPMPWFTPGTTAVAAHALAAAATVSPTAATGSPAPQYAATAGSTTATSVPASSSAASTATSLSPWAVAETQFAAVADRPIARRARALASPLAYTAPPHVHARSAMMTGSAPPPAMAGSVPATAWHDHHAAAVALMMAASGGRQGQQSVMDASSVSSMASHHSAM